MHPKSLKIYRLILHFSIFVFAITLAWFGLIYYPKIVDEFKNGEVSGTITAPAIASGSSFPIETKAYRLTYEPDSSAYKALIYGKRINTYIINKEYAQFALKNALSEISLCNVDVVFQSAEGLNLSAAQKQPANCL